MLSEKSKNNIDALSEQDLRYEIELGNRSRFQREKYSYLKVRLAELQAKQKANAQAGPKIADSATWAAKKTGAFPNLIGNEGNNIYDRVISWAKGHWFTTVILIVGALVIGAGTLTDAVDKIITFKQKYGKTETKSVLPKVEPVVKQVPTNVLVIPSKSRRYKALSPLPNNLNPDYHRRDEILEIEFDWAVKKEGAYDFDKLDLEKLKLLIAENFIDLEDSQNGAPKVKEFIKFLEIFPEFRASGYAVSPGRKDYRVTLNGMNAPQENLTPDMVNGFLEFCSGSDDITPYLSCWWD